jgi:RNA polymerase sigma-70 factor (ECF subfamily)
VDISGKESWCEDLYEHKAKEFLLFCRALGLSHGESEDLVQETFVLLMRLTEVPRNPAHYCIRAFRNRALNFKRTLWRRVAREFESLRWFERESDETESERSAMRCLERLPRDQREVIVLKIWHEHTFEEIGEFLDISPNTAAGRYRYGIKKLKACLKEHNYERFEIDRGSASQLEVAPAL